MPSFPASSEFSATSIWPGLPGWQRKSKPDVFIVKPNHHMPGPNTYNGKVGGGFNCWPNGPSAEPLQINAPMWGKAVVVENEMMFHHGQATGPVAQRKPQGLDITSTFGADPEDPTGWQVETFGKVNQKVPGQEMRFLVHWGARLFKDMADLKRTCEHADDIGAETAITMLINDMKKRGVAFEVPTDPLHDNVFVGVLAQAYNIGGPINIPPDGIDEAA